MGHTHYYTVGRIKFESKIDACIFAQAVNKPVEWVFGLDDIFKNYDWSNEPTESLDFYYDARAREIREKYDYVIIAYSGGADSNNLLTSFTRQGLCVDEIFNVHCTELTEKHLELSGNITSPYNVDSEYILNVLPKLKNLRNQLTNTKITSIDMSNFCYSPIATSDESWVSEMSDIRNIYNFRYDWFQIPEFKKLLDTGKSVCVVSGADKPLTHIKDKNFYVRFADIVYATGTPYPFRKKYGYTNFGVEYFYWGTSTADMICKQVHTIKKNLEYRPELKRLWDIDAIPDFKLANLKYHQPMIVPWIYTTWDNGFQIEKDLNGFWATEHDNIWKSVTEQQQLDVYSRGLEYLSSKAKNFLEYKNGVPVSLRTFGKQYLVSEIR